MVFYFLFFLLRLCLFHIIVIPNHTQQLFLVLIHFTIFPSFITVAVNFIFSHTTPCSSCPLLSLFLLHLTLHKRSYFLSLMSFFRPLIIILFPLYLYKQWQVGWNTMVIVPLLQQNSYLFTISLYFKSRRILSPHLTPFCLSPAPGQLSEEFYFIIFFSLRLGFTPYSY